LEGTEFWIILGALLCKPQPFLPAFHRSVNG